MSVWTNSSHVPVENLKKSFTFYAIYLYHITAPLYIVNVIVAIKIYNNGKQVFIWGCINIYSINKWMNEWMEITYCNLSLHIVI